MKQRIQIDQLEPNGYKAMFGLEHYIRNSGLDKGWLELIKIRASQINKCAFCINMHTTDALNNGETPQRIFQLAAWEESSLFSDEEKLILKITEEVTSIQEQGLSEETYQSASETFNDNTLAQIIMAVTIINAWNRIAVSTHKPFN
ncbi:carboxymuconolactone decarboxylase family protein [Fulvivirga ligni]|uniref:carboxymuconolactone decarboxylase family protein n=1 Tax=Fulvivirga ligni TaxID=2904246 RepID=UPI001F249142|nr:carboxymuconolactone decarboxylase family protein [Fulvivirga ligni]UII19869.1 carboxymuconolactone decarboxylase family protein [Fulvivirga ligni]